MYRRFLTAGAAAMLATALLLSGCSKKTHKRLDHDVNVQFILI